MNCFLGDRDKHGMCCLCASDRTRTVCWHPGLREPRIGDGNKFNTSLVLPRKTDGSPICWLEKCSQFPDRCEPPFFFATTGNPEVGYLSGENAWCKICCRCDSGSSHPTAPSIWSSMSRFSSIAYSMGSSRAIGSTNPRTIMAIASSSLSPRVMR